MAHYQKPERGSLESLYMRLFKDLKRKRRDWKITPQQFLKIISLPCIYCGSEPRNMLNGALEKRRVKKYPDAKYQGIDRVDSTIGYTKDNCVPCCWVCNRIKGQHSIRGLTWHLTKMLPHLTALLVSRQKIKSGRKDMELLSELDEEIINLSGVKRSLMKKAKL